MPQLTLFPDLKPRIPKAVVVQAGTLRNAIKGRREVRYWRWMQRVVLLDRISVPVETKGQKYYVPTRKKLPPLTPDQVRDIHASDLKAKELAVKYRRSLGSIYDVINGDSYADVV